MFVHQKHLPPALTFSFPFIKERPYPALFSLNLGRVGWKEWVDKELSDVGFMEALQRAGMLKAIVSSWCLHNYCDLFNLCHLVRWWCCATCNFFISCGELTVTLKDVENQLLLPILGDMDPSNIQLSAKVEAVEMELRKGA